MTRYHTLRQAEIAADKEEWMEGRMMSALYDALISAGENADDQGLVNGSREWRSEVLREINGWEADGRTW